MNDAVTYSRDAHIAFVCLTNPPVNALGHAVRAGLMNALDTALSDDKVRAIVVHGAGRMLSAGADIREFGKPLQQPDLRAVIAAYEASTKPIVVVLHGSVAGGGLEFALGCNYRVAMPGTRVALPEVKLGLIPGAGGTQRLPRLVGVAAAVDIVTSGRFVGAEEAALLGVVDTLAADDKMATTAGTAFAQRVLDENLGLRRIRDMELSPNDAVAADEARANIARRARGQVSPLSCLAAVRAATELEFDAGLQRERELFEDCMANPQRAAMIHAFFGEREVARVPGLAKDTQPRPVERVAIVGAGTMGGGIAMCFADAGIPVDLIEQSDNALARGVGRIRSNYEQSAKRGRLSNEDVESRMALLSPSTTLTAAASADFVIEAVFEDMAVKQDVFGNLDQIAKPGAVLATNTSYLNVNEIARMTTRPGDVLGTHFFSPANVMRLLEVVRAEETRDDVLATALKLGAKLKKVTVVSGVCDGFIGNRMLNVYLRQANYMLEDGALPQEIDKAITSFGFAMGPFAMGDLAGLDIGYANRRREDATRDPAIRYVDIADTLYELGRYGQKTGAGWYLYEEGSRAPIPDPKVESIIIDASKRKGITRTVIPADEILERVLCGLANEGARILEEGIAARSVDIDMVWINGYAFPAHQGGPMFWADTQGLDVIADKVATFARSDPDNWQIAPLLAELAATGTTFKQWSERSS